MTFRTRLTIALILLGLVPLAGVGLAIRAEMATRLEEQAAARTTTLIGILRQDFAAAREASTARLAALGAELVADSRFRLAVGGDPSARRWLLDWAAPAMRLAGLDLLEVLDSAHRIVSSGHFRNEYDRPEPGLVDLIRSDSAGEVLVSARLADGTLPALVTVDTFRVGDRRYAIVGGTRLDSARVARFGRGEEIAVGLTIGGPPPNGVAIEWPYLDAVSGAKPSRAAVTVAANPELARSLVRRLDRWLALAFGASLAVALAIAWWLGRVVAQPVIELAGQAGRIDLDRLDVGFATDRPDELGVLARGLDQMTNRLRQSAARQREAERQAAVGDVARQVNHDIKNGLAPLRHVLGHLGQTAEREPAAVAALYLERRGTIEASLEYLEQLARRYAALSPALAAEPCDPAQVIALVARSTPPGSAVIETRVASEVPRIRADAVVLRRILENLVTNAIEALDGRPGRIVLSAAVVGVAPNRMVRLAVADTGPGIPPERLVRLFDGVGTTKPTGSGLGLSVVRRLVTDLGGAVRVESALGQGTTFTVDLPPT